MCYGRPCTMSIVRMLRKLTVSYGPTEILSIYRHNINLIGASPGPGGLPAGEATPSRQSYADCGTGTPGGRFPRLPGSIYTNPRYCTVRV